MSAPVFLLLLLLPFATPQTLTLNLTQKPLSVPANDPWAKLSQLAEFSLARAHHLKNRHHYHGDGQPIAASEVATANVAPRSSGEYVIGLRFGTPAQPLPFVLDTGSTLVWFPCSHNFRCRNCRSPVSALPPFIPKSSSSARLVGCRNPKCRWIHSRLPSNCSLSSVCPPYFVLYGSASTGGILLSETLSLPGKPVANFAVGCSVFSDHQETGVAGFGRGQPSFPSQLGVGSFSYCLPSHRLDDVRGAYGTLVLGENLAASRGLTFTPFLRSPARFGAYYYVGLRKITVGSVAVDVPPLRPDGNGGTIIDSGTSFTVIEGGTHDRLAAAFASQVRGYRRAVAVEKQSGLRPCFEVGRRKSVALPAMALHFDGGAVLTLPLKNYFSFVGETDAICLTVIGAVGEGTVGPAVILGNYQQQDYYITYDTVKERIGFRPQTCQR
ncbi:Aspartic proteinase nepenthesin-2 [Nymphaea thermarum]|nr:Aspartic proteinase nepenthesin-2 [Nymphaea thermarum]